LAIFGTALLLASLDFALLTLDIESISNESYHQFQSELRTFSIALLASNVRTYAFLKNKVVNAIFSLPSLN
jgi:hypothetical protein